MLKAQQFWICVLLQTLKLHVVICGKECTHPQHRLLVGDFKLCTQAKSAKSHLSMRWICTGDFDILQWGECKRLLGGNEILLS